jgi:hypothetical protein
MQSVVIQSLPVRFRQDLTDPTNDLGGPTNDLTGNTNDLAGAAMI